MCLYARKNAAESGRHLMTENSEEERQLFHMLTCFDLKSGVDLERFQAALDAYAGLMLDRG